MLSVGQRRPLTCLRNCGRLRTLEPSDSEYVDVGGVLTITHLHKLNAQLMRLVAAVYVFCDMLFDGPMQCFFVIRLAVCDDQQIEGHQVPVVAKGGHVTF